ncbi:MAG TPA: hypothetical protein VFB54_13675 [Burkholderiales bacterium]|nr:hypothetical protein [Burkholderiales bacterium]
MAESSTSKKGQERQARWRKLVAQQRVSGQSIAAFCREHCIAEQSFYGWRSRLGQWRSPAKGARNGDEGAFIDLGAMASASAATSPHVRGLDIRLELPGGITLSIRRN